MAKDDRVSTREDTNAEAASSASLRTDNDKDSNSKAGQPVGVQLHSERVISAVTERLQTVAKSIKKVKSLAAPTRLRPVDRKEGLVQVIIETPAGSRNKFSFDVDQSIFALKKVLPAGMTFPYDFGFLPMTKADDGDPIDVLLLMDEPAFPGCAVWARLIGVIEGEQIDGKKRIRNDRLVAVADMNHMYANIKQLKDLPTKWLDEVQTFFVNYHNLEGKKYKLLGCKGAEVAFGLIKQAQQAV